MVVRALLLLATSSYCSALVSGAGAQRNIGSQVNDLVNGAFDWGENVAATASNVLGAANDMAGRLEEEKEKAAAVASNLLGAANAEKAAVVASNLLGAANDMAGRLEKEKEKAAAVASNVIGAANNAVRRLVVSETGKCQWDSCCASNKCLGGNCCTAPKGMSEGCIKCSSKTGACLKCRPGFDCTDYECVAVVTNKSIASAANPTHNMGHGWSSLQAVQTGWGRLSPAERAPGSAAYSARDPHFHRTALYGAARRGDLRAAEFLLGPQCAAPLLGAQCDAGSSPLHAAAHYGHASVVELLLRVARSRGELAHARAAVNRFNATPLDDARAGRKGAMPAAHPAYDAIIKLLHTDGDGDKASNCNQLVWEDGAHPTKVCATKFGQKKCAKTCAPWLQLAVAGEMVSHPRMALVIGNGGYKELSRLENAKNDAEAMSTKLKLLQFDVTVVYDANFDAMQGAIDAFMEKLVPNVVAFFYYAGHGAAPGGKANYLLPVDIDMAKIQKNPKYLGRLAFDVRNIVNDMEERQIRVFFMILDASHRDPFGDGSRTSASGGMAAMSAPEGGVIVFAAKSGQMASDGVNKDGHGLFTGSLLQHMDSDAHLPLLKLLTKVRIDVHKQSGNRQLPEISSGLFGDGENIMLDGNVAKVKVQEVWEGRDELDKARATALPPWRTVLVMSITLVALAFATWFNFNSTPGLLPDLGAYKAPGLEAGGGRGGAGLSTDTIAQALAFIRRTEGASGGAAGVGMLLSRFSADANMLRTGEVEEGADGIWLALGVEEGGERCLAIQRDGCAEIKREFERHGQADPPSMAKAGMHDGLGSDWARFEYVRNAHAKKLVQRNGAGRDAGGNSGKTLSDFMKHPHAGKLKQAHILSLRLYTSNSYPRINDPLRQGTKPHLFAATTYYVADALKLLRGARAAEGVARRTFWRGLDNMGAGAAFFAQGGTEMGCMSTTEDQAVARKFAKVGEQPNPLLLKVEATSLMDCGADLAWLSMYPEEKEVLFPPLTYLKPESMAGQAVGSDPHDCTVITVRPQWA
jgi:hypothetical protein